MDTDDLLDILEDAIAVDDVQSRAEARRCLQLLLNRPLISYLRQAFLVSKLPPPSCTRQS